MIKSGLRASVDRRGRTVLLALSSIAAVLVTMVTNRLALAAVAGLGLRISHRRDEG
ncbi:MAG: hypothetical protein V3S20_10945 [Dehalococcoidia bacterium]